MNIPGINSQVQQSVQDFMNSKNVTQQQMTQLRQHGVINLDNTKGQKYNLRDKILNDIRDTSESVQSFITQNNINQDEIKNLRQKKVLTQTNEKGMYYVNRDNILQNIRNFYNANEKIDFLREYRI